MVGSRDLHTTPGQVVTIAAATGGHLAAVERFAVTEAPCPLKMLGAAAIAAPTKVRNKTASYAPVTRTAGIPPPAA
jgi:hypothetical protein